MTSQNHLVANAVQYLFAALLVSLFSGCASLEEGGVYNSDKVLYKAEIVIPTSYSVIHTYVKWEAENRSALTNFPGIKTSADVMRKNAKQWFTTANAMRDAYAAEPSDANREVLEKILNVLRVALAEANAYMIQATQP